MSRYKKLLRWSFFSLSFFVAALIIFLVIAPRLLNMVPIQKAIVTAISQKAGIEVKIEKISVSFLPRPKVTLYKGKMEFSQTVAANWSSLSIAPELLPVLTGRIRIDRLSVKRPEIDIAIPEKFNETNGGRATSIDEIFRETIAPAVGILTSIGNDLDVMIADGRVNIILKDKTGLRFTDMDAQIGLSAGTLSVRLESKTDFCKKIVLKAGMDLQALKSRGQIELFQLRPQQLPANLICAGDTRIGASLVNLILKFSTNRFYIVRAELQGTLPMLTVQRGRSQHVFKGQALKAQFKSDEKKAQISLTQLKLDQPRLTLAGTFLMDRANGKLEAGLEGTDVDITSTRQAVLKLAGDFAGVKKIFDIVKGGNIPTIRYKSRGSTINDLGKLGNITLNGSLTGGKIVVPGLPINVDRVDADVKLAGGMLKANKLTARCENHQVTEGSMRLGLSGDNSPFHLDIGLKVDLSQIPSLLKQIVDNERFLDKLDRIRDISGRADGRLILGESLDAIDSTVTVSDFNLSARVPRLPQLLKLEGRNFTYSGAAVAIMKLNGRVKNFDFSLGDIAVNWKKSPVIRIRSGAASGDLNEIHAWLETQKFLPKSIEDIKTVTGSVRLSQLELNGPLDEPSNWQYRLAGSFENIHVKSDLLPAPLSVRSASFSGTPDAVILTGAETHIMDASMTLSGRFIGYRKGLHEVGLAFQGDVGAAANRWLNKTFRLPPRVILRPPLKISKGRFSWGRNGRIAFAGDLIIDNDLQLSADVLLQSEKIHIKKFFIRDKDSNAVFSLVFHKTKDIDFSFNGILQKSTVNRLLIDNQNIHGWIKGDLRLRYFTDRPMNARFEGNLDAKDLALSKHFNIPVMANRLSIEGHANKFQVAADILFQQDQHLDLKGDVSYSPKGIIFDTDIYSSGILLDDLAEGFVEIKNEGNDVRKETFWDFPVQGVVRFDSDYVRYGQFTWRPLRTIVTLLPDKITVTVGDATLCGISTPGTLILSPRKVEFVLSPAAQNQDLDSSVTCLLDKTAKIQGGFNMAGKIKGQGSSRNLLDSLSGDIQINATKGRIFAGRTFGTLRKIVSLLNITEIYRGKLPELRQNSFDYNSIEAKVTIENRSIVVEEIFIDGLTMGIAGKGVVTLTDKKVNATALVAPLKTVDSVVKRIPLVGYILGGNLISIPFGIKGDLNDLKVSLMPPSAVEEGVVGIMKRTLKLPVKIIDSFTPEKKR